MINKIIFRKRPSGSYSFESGHNPKLSTLGFFLFQDFAAFSKHMIAQIDFDTKNDEPVYGNCTYIGIRQNKIFVGDNFTEEDEPPIEIDISKENFEEMLEKWYELYHDRYDEITITQDDDGYIRLSGHNNTTNEEENKLRLERWKTFHHIEAGHYEKVLSELDSNMSSKNIELELRNTLKPIKLGDETTTFHYDQDSRFEKRWLRSTMKVCCKYVSGFYDATVLFRDRWYFKKKIKMFTVSFFPNDWPKDNIVENCVKSLCDKNASKEVIGSIIMIDGKDQNGTNIRTVFDKDGNVLTAYPLLKLDEET